MTEVNTCFVIGRRDSTRPNRRIVDTVRLGASQGQDSQGPATAAAADTVKARFAYIEWNRQTGKTMKQVNCVLDGSGNDQSLAVAMDRFVAGGSARLSQLRSGDTSGVDLYRRGDLTGRGSSDAISSTTVGDEPHTIDSQPQEDDEPFNSNVHLDGISSSTIRTVAALRDSGAIPLAAAAFRGVAPAAQSSVFCWIYYGEQGQQNELECEGGIFCSYSAMDECYNCDDGCWLEFEVEYEEQSDHNPSSTPDDYLVVGREGEPIVDENGSSERAEPAVRIRPRAANSRRGNAAWFTRECDCGPDEEWDDFWGECTGGGEGDPDPGGGGPPPPPPPPAIALTCNQTALARGDSLTCTASAPGALVIQEWIFDATEAGFSNSFNLAHQNPLPTVWAGRMIAGGTVSVTGTIDGAAANIGVAAIAVNARNWADSAPHFIINEIGPHIGANPLPVNPRDSTQLGDTEMRAQLSAGVTHMVIPSGPNEGASYMLAMHSEAAYIRINRQAFGVEHPWVLAHFDPPSPAGRCSRTQIRGIETFVEQHEGVFAGGFNNPSHARRLRDRMQTYALGNTIEAVREPAGPVARAHIEAVTVAARADAHAHSAAFDPQPVLGGTCTIFWGY